MPHRHINQIKEFLYQILHRYDPVKANVRRFIADRSNRWTFCDCEGETVEHVFVDCFSSFWFHLEKDLSGEYFKKKPY